MFIILYSKKSKGLAAGIKTLELSGFLEVILVFCRKKCKILPIKIQFLQIYKAVYSYLMLLQNVK